ncbi:MAG: hypothetical protein JWO26_338 [Rhodospirillales bacterium]|nr:hypothetical protein [Rhodospirillales bacterium]
MDLLGALSEWRVAALLRNSGTAYALVNSAHVASIGLLFGAIVTLDLRLVGAFRQHPVAHLAPPLVQVAGWGFAFATATGFLLFSVRPLAYLDNIAFQLKLGLLALAGLNVLLLKINPRWRVAVGGRTPLASVRAAALVSLILWMATIVAGRWIGFLM